MPGADTGQGLPRGRVAPCACPKRKPLPSVASWEGTGGSSVAIAVSKLSLRRAHDGAPELRVCYISRGSLGVRLGDTQKQKLHVRCGRMVEAQRAISSLTLITFETRFAC